MDAKRRGWLAGRWLAVAIVFVATSDAVAKPPKPSPAMQAAELPQPPQQHSPWKVPESNLPATFVSAAEQLFRQGLADPRGCEYRTIEIGTGSCWSGDAGVMTTHGWVLPADAQVAGRFAVCWNGLVYPTVSIGDKADLRADIDTLVKADDALRAKAGGQKFAFFRMMQAWSEPHSSSHATFLPLKAVLLLRLGEVELAERFWMAWMAGMTESINNNRVDARDPYLLLATDWVWGLFDRAVCAHMRADDRLALASARALVLIQAAIEAEAKLRGFSAPPTKTSYLNFLEQLPELLADQQRRAAQPPIDKADWTAQGIADNPRRVAALVRNLEQVRGQQWAQPGGVDLGNDPVVLALVDQGDLAVDPLIACLESDQRLTRSVQLSRDFHYDREIMGVHRVAFTALSQIVKTSYFSAAPTYENLTSQGLEGRRIVAAQIRDYWQKYQQVALPERWYRTLADDEASEKSWLEAAVNVVKPADVPISPGNTSITVLLGWFDSPPRKPAEKIVLSGEALRDKKNPSVAELLARHARALAQPRLGNSNDTFRLFDATEMVVALDLWDRDAARPVVRAQLDLYRAKLPSEAFLQPNIAQGISRLTSMLAREGDPAVLDEYAKWIRTVTPEMARGSATETFRPLWLNPDHPAMAESAAWLFEDPQSPWNPLLQKRQRGGYWLEQLFKTPLVGVPGFQRQLLVQLKNKEPAGKVKLREDACLEVHYDSGGSGSRSIRPDPLAPPLGVEVEFRACDLHAWLLSFQAGMPRCELYWPVAKRDEAVAACAAEFREHGARFKYKEQ